MSKINYYNSLKNNLKFGQLLIKDYLKLLTLVETMSTTSRKKLKAQYLAMNVFLFLQLAVTFHTTNGKLVNENITVTSESSDHSRIATHTCIMKMINKILDLPEV